VAPSGRAHLVAVTVGLIDDTQGLAEVQGSAIHDGISVLAPTQ